MRISSIDENRIGLDMESKEAAFIARMIDKVWAGLSAEDQLMAETIQGLLEGGIVAAVTGETGSLAESIKKTKELLGYEHHYFLIAKNNWRARNDSAA